MFEWGINEIDRNAEMVQFSFLFYFIFDDSSLILTPRESISPNFGKSKNAQEYK